MFNVVENKSSAWGTSPFYWYFQSALPRALLLGVPLTVTGAFTEARVRPCFVVAISFVLLYSFVPHKELRFVLYTIPLFNAVGGALLARLWDLGWPTPTTMMDDHDRGKRLVMRGIVILLLAFNTCVTALFAEASFANYPGGEALRTLHALRQDSPGSVHVDVFAAMNGINRFGQLPHSMGWTYDKTEGLAPSALDTKYLIAEKGSEKALQRSDYETIATISQFNRLAIDHIHFPPLKFIKIPAVVVMEKRQSAARGTDFAA